MAREGKFLSINRCRASAGLRSLRPGKQRKKAQTGSWKGWTWHSNTEKIYNGDRDLLERVVV